MFQRKNRTTLKLVRGGSRDHFIALALPSLATEQVMQLPVSPLGKPNELHLLILNRQWAEIRQIFRIPSKTEATSATSAVRRRSLKSTKSSSPPFKSLSSLQKALLQRDEYGRTPLFSILQRRLSPKNGVQMAPPDIIIAILFACPRAASIPDIKNNYPLHMAVRNGHKRGIVRTILQCYPGAVLEQNEDHDTPLILAANFSVAVQMKQQDSGEGTASLLPVMIKPSDSPNSIEYASHGDHNNPECYEAFQGSSQWEILKLCLQYHPEAACIRNRHGMSVLEMALQRHAPANVIRNLLRADKAAASLQRPIVAPSKSGVCGRGVSQNGVVTPLSLAVLRGAHEEVLGMLSYAFPQALLMRDECGLSPLAKCWLEWYYVTHSSPTGNRKCVPERQAMLINLYKSKGQELHPQLRAQWLKLQTLLCASHHPGCIRNMNYHHHAILLSFDDGDQKSQPLTPNASFDAHDFATCSIYDPQLLPLLPPNNAKFLAVHAAASQDCPVEVLAMAMILHPHQVVERDQFGRIPLHLAAEAPIYTAQPYEPAIFSNPIERLVTVYPAGASVVDGHGMLPLHIAIRSGKKWDEGLSSLVAAEPRALHKPDPITGLFPVMMAVAAYNYRKDNARPRLLRNLALHRAGANWHAVMTEQQRTAEIARARNEEDLLELSSLFELVRAGPSVLTHCNYSGASSQAMAGFGKTPGSLGLKELASKNQCKYRSQAGPAVWREQLQNTEGYALLQKTPPSSRRAAAA